MVKIKGITARENKAIAEYERLLLSKFSNRIKKLMLFGSKARGTSSPNSDIDILVVITKNGKSIRRDIAALTHEPIARFEVELSPIVIEEDDLKEWSPFIAHIKKEAVVIWTKKSKTSM